MATIRNFDKGMIINVCRERIEYLSDKQYVDYEIDMLLAIITMCQMSGDVSLDHDDFIVMGLKGQ